MINMGDTFNILFLKTALVNIHLSLIYNHFINYIISKMDKIEEKYLSHPILNENKQDYDVSHLKKRKQLKKIYLKLFLAS